MKIIYEDESLLVIDKPANIDIDGLANLLSKKYIYLKELPRSGIVHRLDKETSGLILVAKNISFLDNLQKQFKERTVEKKYLCLVNGQTAEKGKIETLIGRSLADRKKQKVYLFNEPGSKGKREAITQYHKIKEFKDYSLLEVIIKTGRKHQIRCHLSYINHPIVGDKVYGFKNEKNITGLERQFLHARYIKINNQEFFSELPLELKKILNKLK